MFIGWMLKFFFHVDLIIIAKVAISKVCKFFSFSMSMKVANKDSKKRLLNFILVRKLIPNQKHLNHLILSSYLKVMSSILQIMKVGKTYKVVF